MRLRYPIYMAITLNAEPCISVFDEAGERVGDGPCLQEVNLVIKFYMESAYTYCPMLKLLPAQWTLKRRVADRAERTEPLPEAYFLHEELETDSGKEDDGFDDLFKAGKSPFGKMVKKPAARIKRQAAAMESIPQIGKSKPRALKKKP